MGKLYPFLDSFLSATVDKATPADLRVDLAWSLRTSARKLAPVAFLSPPCPHCGAHVTTSGECSYAFNAECWQNGQGINPRSGLFHGPIEAAWTHLADLTLAGLQEVAYFAVPVPLSRGERDERR